MFRAEVHSEQDGRRHPSQRGHYPEVDSGAGAGGEKIEDSGLGGEAFDKGEREAVQRSERHEAPPARLGGGIQHKRVMVYTPYGHYYKDLAELMTQ